ncbi:MAG: hypothetical protein JW937_09100 [Candidatus Omnitrophica bacterium]|nr:hypothetical protein [Candidatus Omnitrophota bacterium]
MTATDLPCAMTGLLLLTAAFCFVTPAFAVEPLLVDNFEGPAIQNTLGNRANVFIRAPSRAMTSRRQETVNGKESQVLLLRFDKQEEGGPYGGGGWCGYYTLLKKGSEYLDASQYSKISFWVRGEEGGEVFLMGVADRHWDEVGDSVKSEPIGKYLSGGKVTTEWQQANVPLDYFFVDRAKLSSVAFVFDTGAGAGTIYVDDLKLE